MTESLAFEENFGNEATVDGDNNNLVENFFDGIRDRMKQRRERRNEARSTENNKAEDNQQPQASIFENEGGIASIARPKGFANKSEDEDFGRFVSFGDGKSKVCYWKREDYSPEPASAKKLEEILKKGPHTILTKDPKNPDITIAANDEVDPVYDCLMPGRWSKGGPFDVSKISVQQVNGKNVLSVDVEFDGGRRTSLMIFSPDAKGKTLQHVWVEGNNQAEVDKLHKSVVGSIKWKDK